MNGWTGGQWSVGRFVFGLYLFVHFVALGPWAVELFSREGVLPDSTSSPLARAFPNVLSIWDGPGLATALVLAAAALAIPFALGWRDRWAAVGIWYVAACLFGRNPLIANPSLPFVGWMLLVHACAPRAPYGSLDARGRVDPAGGWTMPPALHGGAWIVMAVGYSYSGLMKLVSPSWVDGTAIARVLANPLARTTMVRDALLALPAPALAGATWAALGLEICFAPLALVRRLRPWLWTALLTLHLGLLVLIDFADLSLGMVMLHLFTFNPAWIRPKAVAGATDRIFYDGSCGLCHGLVRAVIAEDRGGAFRFAPLGSPAFDAAVPLAVRTALPDSVVVVRADGVVLARWAAVVHVLERLGGLWRLLGTTGRISVPVWIGDRLYDAVARRRTTRFTPPTAACPGLPLALRARFDM